MLNVNEILIEKCLRKDRKGQNLLHKACYEKLISVCWRYANSNEQAVEYFNAGFLKILFNLKSYKATIPFELWARRVMINTIIDEYRKQKTYRQYVQRMADEDLLNIEEQISPELENEKEMWEFIKLKVKNLPPVMAKVFNLYAFDGYKHQEIAQMLSISEGTSQYHYSVAKRKLKEMAEVSFQREDAVLTSKVKNEKVG